MPARQYVPIQTERVYQWRMSGTGIPVAGTASASAGSTTVTGTGTRWRVQFGPGDQIQLDTETRTVVTVVNDSTLTVDTPWGASHANAAIYRHVLLIFASLDESPIWTREEPQGSTRIAQALCSGSMQILARTFQVAPPRRTTLTIQCHPDGTEDAQLQRWLACYMQVGPFQLEAPTGQVWTIYFDRTKRWEEQRLLNGGYRVRVDVLEAL